MGRNYIAISFSNKKQTHLVFLPTNDLNTSLFGATPLWPVQYLCFVMFLIFFYLFTLFKHIFLNFKLTPLGPLTLLNCGCFIPSISFKTERSPSLFLVKKTPILFLILVIFKGASFPQIIDTQERNRTQDFWNLTILMFHAWFPNVEIDSYWGIVVGIFFYFFIFFNDQLLAI